jgi:hypothetical protein
MLTAFAIPYEEYETIPFTEISFDPQKPNGENDWYVSDVTVTLNPIGFFNGIEATYYRINSEEWKIYTSPFIISEEGNNILIEYYTVDNNGSAEDVKSTTIDIDKTSPDLEIFWEIVGNPIDGWELVITVRCNENYSGIDRVEFYLNNELQETVTGPGPDYTWSFFIKELNMLKLSGLICNRIKTEENVSFYSIFMKASEIQGLKLLLRVCVYDIAGNCDCDETIIKRILPIEPGFYIFKKLTLPNQYLGYVGRLLITAKF